jgi:anti-anti-sigma factor
MQINVSNDVLTVKLPREFFGAHASPLKKDILAGLHSGLSKIVLDFSEITFLDSMAIGVLIALAKELNDKKLAYSLINVSEYIKWLLADMGLSQLLFLDK